MLRRGIQLGVEMGVIAPKTTNKTTNKKIQTKKKINARKRKSLVKPDIVYRNVKQRGQM